MELDFTYLVGLQGLREVPGPSFSRNSCSWILTNKKRPAATERSEQIQMEF
ncbi:hypothetical protein FOM02_11875 [Bradyrhizobium sp. SEMIA]|nr:hypothetical protein FOM02_11875 [Bradyrhizobium sp. SEMIA]